MGISGSISDLKVLIKLFGNVKVQEIILQNPKSSLQGFTSEKFTLIFENSKEKNAFNPI